MSGGEPIPGPSSEVIPGDSDVTVGELVDANGTGNDDEQPTNAATVQVVYQSEEEGNRTNDGSLQAPKQKEDGNSDNSKTDQGCSGGVKGESETAQKVPASVVISESKFGLSTLLRYIALHYVTLRCITLRCQSNRLVSLINLLVSSIITCFS